MDDVKAVLWAAIEDYAGLWEAVWELRALHRDAAAADLASRAHALVSDFLRDGLIELYRCVEPYGDMTLVDPAEAVRLLESPKSWEVPGADDLSVRFSATGRGEEYYRALWA